MLQARQPLQALRGIAALLVMLYHLGGVASLDKYFGIAWLDLPCSYTDFGVEIFFVLSGFIIALTHQRDWGRSERLGAFLYKRSSRIFPLYWLIFTAVGCAILLSPALRAANPHDLPTILKSLLLLPQDPAVVGGTGAPILIVAWSLQYEMVFYALFALIICHKSFAPVIAAALLVLNAWAAIDPKIATTFPVSFLTSQYVPLFAMGMLVWKLASMQGTTQLKHGTLAFYAGVCLLAATEICKMQQPDHALFCKVTLCGLGAALVVYGVVSNARILPRLFGNKLLQTLGDASYMQFLTHFPVLSLLAKIAMAVHLNHLGVSGALIFCAVAATTCVTVAITLHKLVEKPLGQYLKDLPAPVAGRAPAIGQAA